MMKFRPLFQPKSHLLKLSHPVGNELRGLQSSSAGAWRRRRWMGTAAARKVPSEGVGRSRKRVSKEERKSMVEAYVNKYRMENGGKFPTISDTKKQVGGSYYSVRGILQELEYNSKLPAAETKDKVVGQSDNLSSKKINRVSGVGEVLTGEALVDTNISNEYDISADMVDTSTVTRNNDMPTEDDRSVVGYTAKHEEISEVRKVSDTEVLVETTIVSEGYRISTDDGTGFEDELHKNEDERVMDMSIGSRCNEISNEAEYPTVGQTAEVDGFSGVKANTPMLNNEVSTACEDLTVDRTDKIDEVGQTDKTNETSKVRGDFDSNVLVGEVIDSNDNGIPDDKGSSSQGEASNISSQTMIDTSKVNNYNEISAKYETSIAGQTFKGEGISEDNSGSSSKPSHPSQDPGESRNTEFGKAEEASSQASKADQSTRERTKTEPHEEASLWGNLKSFASSIISIWRK